MYPNVGALENGPPKDLMVPVCATMTIAGNRVPATTLNLRSAWVMELVIAMNVIATIV